jgi:hypothetical protein
LQVYADGIHLNEVGRFIIGCTFYATIFKDDPHGLSGAAYKVTDAALINTIQDVAWKIVRANALDGVASPRAAP